MKRYQFNKLIRSKLPARMIQEGVVITGSSLSDTEYITKLKNKIVEEAEEVMLTEDRESLVKELADVTEVINALAKASDIEMSEIEAERLRKKEINGHFEANNYIHYIEVAEDNHKVIEYLDNKDRPYKLSN